MKVEMMAPAALKPYPGNPRKRDQKAIEAVADSIRQFGFRQPILVDADLVIIAGHGRYAAAKLLKLTEVPVHVAADLSPAQARALRIADNRVAEGSEWDWEQLRTEIKSFELEPLEDEAFGRMFAELNELATKSILDAVSAPARGTGERNSSRPKETSDFHLPLTQGQELTVRSVLKIGKQKFNLESSSETLVKILEAWRDGASQNQ